MPEETNRKERIAALMRHPLSQRSMNRENLGALGTLCDISIQPGWVGIIERLYERFMMLPEERRPVIVQIKEKFGTLRVYVQTVDPDVDAPIKIAEAESARACQVCGCRGRMRKIGRWYATLCGVHHMHAEERHTNLDEVPGADDPPDDDSGER